MISSEQMFACRPDALDDVGAEQTKETSGFSYGQNPIKDAFVDALPSLPVTSAVPVLAAIL